jgi:hypothetical protein
MNEGDRHIYLRANGGEHGWPSLSGERILGQTYWVSQRGQRAAIHFAAGKEGFMEIMSSDCVQSLGVAREARLRAAMRDAVGLRAGAKPAEARPPRSGAPDEPPKSAPIGADPLKGF